MLALETKFRYLDPNPDHADLKNVFLAGMASGTAICLLSPVELVKIRSQMVTDGKRGPVSVIRELYHNGGRSSRTFYRFFSELSMSENSQKGIFSKNGLFRGFTAQLARDPFGYSIYFVPYTIILRWESRYFHNDFCSWYMYYDVRRFLLKTA